MTMRILRLWPVTCCTCLWPSLHSSLHSHHGVLLFEPSWDSMDSCGHLCDEQGGKQQACVRAGWGKEVSGPVQSSLLPCFLWIDSRSGSLCLPQDLFFSSYLRHTCGCMFPVQLGGATPGTPWQTWHVALQLWHSAMCCIMRCCWCFYQTALNALWFCF